MGVAKVANNWASEASPTLGCSIEISRETDQSNWFVGVEYISMFHPNVPPLILRVVNGDVATDTVVIRREYPM